jgi:uncharacterized protein (TIGR00266 family)
MDAKISGTILPVLEMTLDPGDKIVAETGQLSWMTDSIELHTTTATGGAKGLWGAVTRAIGGGGLFMTEYTAPRFRGLVAFAAKLPGAILRLDLNQGRNYFVHRHGFLCGTEGVEVAVGFQRKLGAGIFGGNGFVLQKLSGAASAWVELGGEVVTYDLPAGAVLKVHPGHVGMFEDSVSFDITMMKGFRNVLFGGDGLFLAQLTGPGKVWLQTLTVPNLAHALTPYITSESSSDSIGGVAGAAITGSVAGAVLNGIFGRDDET